MEVKWAAEQKTGDTILFQEARANGQSIAYQATGCADPDFGDYYVEDASAQRAICLAALLTQVPPADTRS
jgi:hypothetical protein